MMKREQKLFAIKSVHTLIFFVESAAILYILYCGLVGRFDIICAIAIALVLVETAIFLGSGARCPLTKWAKKLGDPTGNDFVADMFLPPWAARLIPPVCGSLALGGMLLIVLRVVIQR